MAKDIKSNINIDINSNAGQQIKLISTLAGQIDTLNKLTGMQGIDTKLNKEIESILAYLNKLSIEVINTKDDINSLNNAFRENSLNVFIDSLNNIINGLNQSDIDFNKLINDLKEVRENSIALNSFGSNLTATDDMIKNLNNILVAQKEINKLNSENNQQLNNIREQDRLAIEQEKTAREKEKTAREADKLAQDAEKTAQEKYKAAQERAKKAQEIEKTAQAPEKTAQEKYKAAQERAKKAQQQLKLDIEKEKTARIQLKDEIDKDKEAQRQQERAIKDAANAAKIQEDALVGNINAFKEFASTGKLSESTLSSLATEFGATVPQIAAVSAAIAALVTAFKLYNKLTDETAEAVKNIVNALGTIGYKTLEGFIKAGITGFKDIGDGAKFVVDSIQDIINISDDALNKLKELADVGIEIQNNYFNLSTLLGKDAAQDVSSFVDSLSELYNLDSSSIVSQMNDIVAAAGSMGVSMDETTKAIKNMTIYAQDLSILAGSFEKAQLDIGNAISKGYVGRSSVLYPLMTKNELKQLKDLSNETERYNYLMSISGRIKGRYNDYLKTEAGQIAILNSQYTGLRNNLGTLALGLYAKIAPVLNGILRIANAILETFIKIFKIDIKNYNNVEGVTQGIADSMKDVADATKEANKELASFDDVIQLNDNKDQGDMSSSIKPSDINLWNDLFNAEDRAKTGLDELIERIKILFEQGKYYEAARLLAKALNDYLNGIDWDNIIRKAGKAGKSIASFFNGFIEFKKLWPTLGNTLGNAANTIINFLSKFAKELNWKQLGKDLVNTWISFWDTFDENLAGHALYSWFIGIVNLASGFLSRDGIVKAVKSITDVIVNAFNNFTDDDINTIINNLTIFIDQIIKSIGIIAKRLNTDSIRKTIFGLITGLISNLGKNAKQWGETLGSSLSEIFKFAIGALGAFLEGGGFKPLGDLISSTFTNFFANLSEDDISEAAENIVGLVGNIIETLFNLLNNTIGNEDNRAKIMEFITKLAEGFANNAEEWGTMIHDIVDTVIGIAQEALNTANKDGRLSGAITDFLKKLDLGDLIWKYLDLLVSSFITVKLPILWDRIKNFLLTLITGSVTGLGPTLSNSMEALLNIIKNALKDFGAKFNEFKEKAKENVGKLTESIENKAYEFGEKIGTWLGNLIIKAVTLVNSIKTKITNVITNAIQLWKSILQGLFNFIQNIWSNISGIFSSIGNKLSSLSNRTGGIGGILNKFKGNRSVNSAPTSNQAYSLFSTEAPIVQVPKLAKGGIVNQSTLANIGEQGTEAVLPLQNNTSWMDDLASKIANKLNNAGGSVQNRPLVIDMSSIFKPTYTRSEMIELGQHYAEALQTYGINVSFIY